MWNCSAPSSSLMLPFSDEYVKCEASNSAAEIVGFDKILDTDRDRVCHHMSFAPSFQSLQAPTPFATHSAKSYFDEVQTGESSVYNGDIRPVFDQFSYTKPATTAATHLVRWTAAGEPVADASSLRSSKRLKTRATTTTQGPQHRLECSARPRNQHPKIPCKRSQSLGDKITALQQLVSPYGKTDTASVLQEAAACIRSLHEQIQILAGPFPGISSSSSHDTEEELVSDLRQRGLCVAPLTPAVKRLLFDAPRRH